MFDETVLREISLSDGSSKLIFKHIYIYFSTRFITFSFDSILRSSFRLYNIFRTNFKFSKGDYENSFISLPRLIFIGLIHPKYFLKKDL